MIRNLPFTVLMLSLFVGTAWAQDKQVSGKVTAAEDGSPLPGVNVLVQGTSKGTSTDVDGNYSIQLSPQENILVFSFVGYKSTTVQVDGRSTIDVPLEGDVTAL